MLGRSFPGHLAVRIVKTRELPSEGLSQVRKNYHRLRPSPLRLNIYDLVTYCEVIGRFKNSSFSFLVYLFTRRGGLSDDRDLDFQAKEVQLGDLCRHARPG